MAKANMAVPVAPGILLDAHGYRVRVSVGGRRAERRYPGDTPLLALQNYRRGLLAELTELGPRTPGRPRRPAPERRIPINLRMDPGVLAAAKAEAKRRGTPYQTLMLDAIRRAVMP